MATRIQIFDRAGIRLDEINARCTRSWILDGIGVAKITLASSDSKATFRNLFPGNLVFIENSRAGNWGGILWTPVSFLRGSVALTCYSAEYILRQRRVTPFTASGTAGQIFQMALTMANQQEETRIIAGTIESDGPAWSEVFKYQTIYEIMVKCHEKSGQDWSLIPAIGTDGRLTFQANWHIKRGSAFNYRLEEGLNLEAPEGAVLTVEEDVANDVLVYGNSGSITSALYSNKIDQLSRGAYGLRQASFGVDSTDTAGLDAAAAAKLLELAYPTNTHRLVILDQPSSFPAFNFIDLGNQLVYNNASYGFNTQTGAIGQGEVNIRITHREYDETVGKMPITAYEV